MDTKITNLIKKKNLKLVRYEMKKVRNATKPELAERTGISLVTVNSLVKDLLKSGEVLEDAMVKPKLGRPAVTYKYNSEYQLGLVILMHEMGKKDIAYFSVCNLYGEKIARSEKLLGTITKESFDSTIDKLLLRYPAIQVIGFGLPVQEVNERLSISDYNGLLDVEFRSYIEEKYRLPVFIENDINAAVIGHCYLNNRLSNECVIGLYFPSKYEPGAGIYRNGELIKGRNGLAGEIKYLPLDIDYKQFGSKENVINHFALKVIKIFMCLYNPEKIIIYKEKNSYDFANKIETLCLSRIEKMLIPEIKVSNEINRDFENGMICLALEQLDNKNELE